MLTILKTTAAAVLASLLFSGVASAYVPNQGDPFAESVFENGPGQIILKDRS